MGSERLHQLVSPEAVSCCARSTTWRNKKQPQAGGGCYGLAPIDESMGYDCDARPGSRLWLGCVSLRQGATRIPILGSFVVRRTVAADRSFKRSLQSLRTDLGLDESMGYDCDARPGSRLWLGCVSAPRGNPDSHPRLVCCAAHSCGGPELQAIVTILTYGFGPRWSYDVPSHAPDPADPARCRHAASRRRHPAEPAHARGDRRGLGAALRWHDLEGLGGVRQHAVPEPIVGHRGRHDPHAQGQLRRRPGNRAALP